MIYDNDELKRLTDQEYYFADRVQQSRSLKWVISQLSPNHRAWDAIRKSHLDFWVDLCDMMHYGMLNLPDNLYYLKELTRDVHFPRAAKEFNKLLLLLPE
jgi:hypothetical protein